MIKLSVFLGICCFSISLWGQSIVQKNNQFGIVGKDGSLQLPISYDSIYFPSKYWTNSSLLIVKKSGKFGFFQSDNASFSGLLFDELKMYEDLGLLTFRNQNKWGFISFSANYLTQQHTTRYTELVYCPAQYDYVGPSWTPDNKQLTAKDHNQYGLLDFYSGDTLVPLRFKYPITAHRASNGELIYKSSDSKGIDPDTLINPKKNIVFQVDHDARIEQFRGDSIVVVQTEFVNDYNGKLEFVNFNTGLVIFTYAFQRDYIRFEDYDFQYERLGNNHVTIILTSKRKEKQHFIYQISCFELQSNYRKFYYEGPIYNQLLPVSTGNEKLLYLTNDLRKLNKKNCVAKINADQSITWLKPLY